MTPTAWTLARGAGLGGRRARRCPNRAENAESLHESGACAGCNRLGPPKRYGKWGLRSRCGLAVKAVDGLGSTSAPRPALPRPDANGGGDDHRKTKRWTLTALAGVAALRYRGRQQRRGILRLRAQPGADARGPITYVPGKDNSNVAPRHREVERRPPQREGHAQGAVRRGRPAARRPGAAPPGQGPQLRHRHGRRGLDGRVRRQGMAAAPDGQYRAGPPSCSGPPVKAATYNGKLYAAPPPATVACSTTARTWSRPRRRHWDEMWPMCSIAKKNGMDCFAGQFAKYEGLTCNATEAINTFGGKVVDDKGQATVDSPESRKGLQMLADHYKNGDIPKQAITFQEEQGRVAFEAGKLLFLRNWPYVYSLASTDGLLEGQGQVRGRAAARRGRPRRLDPRRAQRGDQRLLQAQGDRARLPEVHRAGRAAEVLHGEGLARPGRRVHLRRPGPGQEGPVPARPC